jgi:nucleotide-binding universal stress UspA family protein
MSSRSEYDAIVIGSGIGTFASIMAKLRKWRVLVLGVRDAAGRLGAATQLERTTAHKVVAHAACPVLMVRG